MTRDSVETRTASGMEAWLRGLLPDISCKTLNLTFQTVAFGYDLQTA